MPSAAGGPRPRKGLRPKHYHMNYFNESSLLAEQACNGVRILDTQPYRSRDHRSKTAQECQRVLQAVSLSILCHGSRVLQQSTGKKITRWKLSELNAVICY